MKRLLILLIFIISLILFSTVKRPPFTEPEILASFLPDLESHVLKRDVMASRTLIQNIECPIAIKSLEKGRSTLMIKITDANYFPDVCKAYFFLSEVRPLQNLIKKAVMPDLIRHLPFNINKLQHTLKYKKLSLPGFAKLLKLIKRQISKKKNFPS